MQCKHTLLSLILKTWHLKNPTSVGTAEQYQGVGITYAAVICAVYWLVPEPLTGRPELRISLLSHRALFLAPEAIRSHKSQRILEFSFTCVRVLKELK